MTRALASKPGTPGALAIYGISLGTLTQYSATPGTQVAGATKHRQGAPRVVPGVTAQVTDSVTHTFEGAAERLDTGEGACVIMKTSAPSTAVPRGKDHHHRPAVLFIAPPPVKVQVSGPVLSLR